MLSRFFALPLPSMLPRRLAPAAALLAAVALSGCVTDSRSSMAALPASGTATLAFDSIDGPPPEVFNALLKTLEDEAQTRNLAIVSREGPASYRLRGYYSAQVKRGQVTIAWVWDIYDSEQERQTRLSGEEPAGRGTARNAWTAANDQVLRAVTRRGMDGVAALLGTPAAPGAAPPVPAGNGPAVAQAPSDPDLSGVLAFRAD